VPMADLGGRVSPISTQSITGTAERW
jgi:hypothetical protein